MIRKATKKPVTIEFVKFEDTSECLAELSNWMNQDLRINYEGSPFIIIPTLEGDMKAQVGDIIIKGLKGEFYPCKPDIFEKSYDIGS